MRYYVNKNALLTEYLLLKNFIFQNKLIISK
uniref:Uncharacterized protein n=1 Tax=Myoviridae sp. ctGrV43 TaxID=2825075 RepID=A0A8S5UEY8_9CAUD|nr:MAG TPA: hypothetical protein [Myoviridae sp. ctGrV43]